MATQTETRAPVRQQRAMMDGPLNEWMKLKSGLLLERQKMREERNECEQAKIAERTQKSGVQCEDIASGKRR